MSVFQELSAETDAVDNCWIVVITLWGQWTYAIYALLFHYCSVLINDGVSLTAAAVVATSIQKLHDVQSDMSPLQKACPVWVMCNYSDMLTTKQLHYLVFSASTVSPLSHRQLPQNCVNSYIRHAFAYDVCKFVVLSKRVDLWPAQCNGNVVLVNEYVWLCEI